MLPARNFSPPLMNDTRCDDADGKNFLTLNVTAVKCDGGGAGESPLGNRNIVSYYLLHLGSNVHVTPHLDDSSERKSISKERTFGNKSQLQATVSEFINLNV